MRAALILLVTGVVLVSLAKPHTRLLASGDDPLRLPEEKHLRNIRQLSFGGENAEA
jgi:hypothetical protein